jgi:hypothetical protein
LWASEATLRAERAKHLAHIDVGVLGEEAFDARAFDEDDGSDIDLSDVD